MTVTLVALVAAGVLAAGCGGGGGDDGDDVASLDEGSSEGESAQSDEEAQEEELLDWVQCMRDEGVEISDPTRDEDGNLVIEGPGIHIGAGAGEAGGGPQSGEDPPSGEEAVDRESMDAAMEACGLPPQIGGQFTDDPETRQAMEDAALEFAECMRDEGIEDFPDPDFSNSGPGGPAQTRTDSGGNAGEEDEGRTVVLGPFGEIDMDDPEVAAAFEQCEDVMRPEGVDDPGGPGSSNESSDG